MHCLCLKKRQSIDSDLFLSVVLGSSYKENKMTQHRWMWRWLSLILICLPMLSNATIPVKSMVVFGDSMSDNGNTTHLLKSLRYEENPAFLVAPFKAFVINKMIDFANDYYVPQMVLDSGISVVTNFFDYDLAPYLANFIGRIKLVPILPGKPYWNSRFSNGRVWNEYLALMLAIPMDDESIYTNKAFGGSWAATYDYQLSVWNLIRHPIATIKTLVVGKLIPPSLGLTVQAYLLTNQRVDEQSVYFIFTGFNDYLNILQFEDNYNPAIMSKYIDNVLDGLASSVKKLEQAGAVHFVVMGIPHVGDMPKFVNTTDRDVLNSAADKHNERLEKRIEDWKKLYPTADFLFINTQRSLTMALTNPGQFGFTNVADACIDVKFPMFGALAASPFAKNLVLQYAQAINYKGKNLSKGISNYQVCDMPEHYLFWDDVHPSTKAHHYLAIDICLAMKLHGYSVTCQSLDSVA